MKKTIFIFSILLIGSRLFAFGESVPRNENCLETDKMKVFQVLENGILGHLCPNDYPDYYDNSFDACNVKGEIIFMAVSPKNNDYVDDQQVTLPSEQCFAKNGTYTYTTQKGFSKTIRKIKIIPSAVTTPSKK